MVEAQNPVSSRESGFLEIPVNALNFVTTTLQRDMLPKDLELVWRNLREAVPNGRTDNGGEHDKGSWEQIPDVVNIAWMELEGGYKQIVNKHPRVSHNRIVNQLGTLGGGNHFLEVVVDESDHVGIMLHSGSRGPGAKIGEYFSRLAKAKLEQWFVTLPDMMPRSPFLARMAPLRVTSTSLPKWFSRVT